MLCGAMGCGAAATAASSDARERAEELVLMVQYIGVDYGRAVRDDRIVDAFEYREMVGFSSRAIEAYETLHGASAPGGTGPGLARLESMVHGLAPWETVRREAQALVTALIAEFGLPSAPLHRPDLVRGHGLYASDCAPCHGPQGGGDGFGDPAMEPPPGSLRGDRMNFVSPYQVFNATRFGIAGTGMPSYRDARDDVDLWDVAFFVMTLRADFDAVATANISLPVGLDELARNSNRQLLARYEADFPDVRRGDVDRLRADPPQFRPVVKAAPPEPRASAPRAPAPDLDANTEIAARLELAFGRVAAEVAPSLVGITLYRRVAEGEEAIPGTASGWAISADDLGRYPGHRPVGIASGFFLSDDGYVATTRSGLVDPSTGSVADLVDVEQADNRHGRARIVALEPTVDLALLKIEPRAATVPVRLGNEVSVRVGQWAIVASDPPGVERGFSVGTIAGKPVRDCYQDLRLATLLQTSLYIGDDAFGGPLLNIRGDVIGMLVPRDPVAGVADRTSAAFALPATLIRTLFDPMRERESRLSPWLGISVRNLGWRLRRQLESAPRTGVWVENVFEPSPASVAGVRPGDVLLQIDTDRMLAVEDFQRALYLAGSDTEVTVQLFREGVIITVNMTIVDRPEDAETR